MKKNGANVIHLATGLVIGYPHCPNIRRFTAFIETAFGLPVVVGTHPIPQKYMEVHARPSFWRESHMEELAKPLIEQPAEIKRAFN